MAGMMGALIGASIFLLLASLTSIPVSTTHAIVGGVVGMTMAGVGGECLNWAIDGGLGGIVLSWIVSPVLSGAIAVIGFGLSRTYIINSPNPRFRALILMPVLYFLSTFILVLVTTLKAKAIKKKMDLNAKLACSLAIATAVALFANFVVKPKVQKTFPSEKELKKYTDGTASSGDVELQKPLAKSSEALDSPTKSDIPPPNITKVISSARVAETGDLSDPENTKSIEQLDSV